MLVYSTQNPLQSYVSACKVITEEATQKNVVAVTAIPLNTNVAVDSNRKCKCAVINLPECSRLKVHLITFQFLYHP